MAGRRFTDRGVECEVVWDGAVRDPLKPAEDPPRPPVLRNRQLRVLVFAAIDASAKLDGLTGRELVAATGLTTPQVNSVLYLSTRRGFLEIVGDPNLPPWKRAPWCWRLTPAGRRLYVQMLVDEAAGETG